MRTVNSLIVAAYYIFGFIVLSAAAVILGLAPSSLSGLGGLAGGAISTAVLAAEIWLLRYGRRRIWKLPKKPRREYPLHTRNGF